VLRRTPDALRGKRTLTSQVVQRKPAGIIQRKTDARLNWAKDGDSEGKGLDAKTLPFESPEPGVGGWNAQEILSKLTQVDEDDKVTTTDQVRCGANAVLAIAIMNGPSAVNDLTTKVMKQGADGFSAAMTKAQQPGIAAPQRDAWLKRASNCFEGAMRMLEPSLNITFHKATYHDLSMIAHCIKMVMSANPQGATTGHEVLATQGLIGETIEGGVKGDLGKGGTRIRDTEHLKSLVAKLDPGDAFTLNVDSDELERDPHQPISLMREINHFVTLGKEKKPAAEGKKPRIYLYDPYPREGMSQFVYSDNPEFWYFFEDAHGTWKSVLLVGHTKAPVD
jgi:hypothetical protein